MKTAIRLLSIPLLLFICLSFSANRIPGKLRRAFEALEVYNYFDAKDLFYRSLKRDSVPAAYGLSVIYGRDDNPFFQIDSAFKFIQIAARRYPVVEPDDKVDYAEYGVDSTSIANQMHRVDSMFYNIALKKDSVKSWNRFIAVHHSQPFLQKAIKNRNEKAYALAESENTAEAYLEFGETYPGADQVREARKKYQKRLYKEKTADGDISDYQSFIREYPGSPYLSEAQDKVYELATRNGTTEDFLHFIHDYPSNENVGRAWHNIYKLEIGELNAKSIAAFSLEYPNYPFMEELKRDFDYATTRYYPIELNGKWGFIDEKGAVKIKPQYDFVEDFSENIALVGRDDAVAFINKAGDRITDFEFTNAYAFKNGYAVVGIDDKYGAINREGEVVVPVKYSDVGEYAEELFYAERADGKFGYLDRNGNTVIPFILDNATDFQSGLAIVEKNGAQGVIDKDGRLILDFKYDWIEPFKANGVPSRMRIDSKFGLVDHHGIVLTDTLYTQIGDFSNGLALATNDEKYGYLDLKGDTAIDFRYTYRTAALKESRFENYHARVYQKDKIGIIDTAGSKIFPAIFEGTGDYIGNLIPVKKRGKWGYADLNIELAIPYRYSAARNFEDSLAVVAVDGKYGMIDTLGQKVIEFKYSSLRRIDSLLLVADTAYGLIDLQGNEVVPLEYYSAKPIDQRVIRFRKTQNAPPEYYDLPRQKFIWKQNS